MDDLTNYTGNIQGRKCGGGGVWGGGGWNVIVGLKIDYTGSENINNIV